jgi:hypothetical protein
MVPEPRVSLVSTQTPMVPRLLQRSDAVDRTSHEATSASAWYISITKAQSKAHASGRHTCLAGGDIIPDLFISIHCCRRAKQQ